MRPSSDALALAVSYRLAIARSVTAGAPGERLGRGTGSSLEFEDRRSYAPGDDVRHLDWRAFARTGELHIRLYREEVSPRVELLCDASRSMAVGDDKARLAIDVAGLIGGAARAEGLELCHLALGDDVQPLERDRFERDGMEFEGARTMTDVLPKVASLLRSGAVRVVVSDFLFPHDPEALVRTLSRGAGAVALLQVLGVRDLEPDLGALRLTDAERGAELDLVLEPGVVADYRRRLRTLTDRLAAECRRVGAIFCELDAGQSLTALCRERPLSDEVLLPA